MGHVTHLAAVLIVLPSHLPQRDEVPHHRGAHPVLFDSPEIHEA